MTSKFRGFTLAVLLTIASQTWAAEPESPRAPSAGKDKAASPASATAPTQAELEQKFAADLSGATLAGHFSVDGKNGNPSEDRYAISKVTKLHDEVWKFDVRIVYGQHDVTLPLPLEVKWAGDTPVITLTDLAVPGLGTYTARVLVYRGQYAGTWSAGDHGGQLWGRIEKAAAGDGDKKKADSKPDAASDSSKKAD
ncbi:MAG TPA: hypothetical protein VMF30_07450 [Pirellulales bacterium]|nr:hypothetical protein [Pirellulales bacterium]